ncbi:hypothetical protein RHGRI_001307 [Rhododendron griersonianum]|uniref:Retrotransposon gag domain-containing protein n=1 Tax=Rhododendron griersonianum TaxID=479676 RepID=A0AAV6LML2_9ERIC|nr:hypothetical protein RHGRI_001307 [Rhododendron griersonianum]
MAMAMFETWTIEGIVFGVDDSNGREGESWGTTSPVEWERGEWERLGRSLAMAMAMFETWTIEGIVSGVDDSNGREGRSWGTTSPVEWERGEWERVGRSLQRLGSTDDFQPDQTLTLDSVVITWARFVKAFNDQFCPESYWFGQEAEFINLKHEGMTVPEYEAKFAALSAYATDLVDTDEKKCRRFRNGLEMNVRTRMMSYKPKDYAELVETASRLARMFKKCLKSGNRLRGAKLQPIKLGNASVVVLLIIVLEIVQKRVRELNVTIVGKWGICQHSVQNLVRRQHLQLAAFLLDAELRVVLLVVVAE